MTVMPPEPYTAAQKLNEALVDFTACIGAALPDVCSYGLIIGEGYVPFDPDPEDNCPDLSKDEILCTQAWVRVESITPQATPNTYEENDGDGTTLAIELEVGILRCFETPEDGQAPTATNILAASMQAIEDMNALYCAAMDCEVWAKIESGSWLPSGPLGGQYGGIWTFTVYPE